MRNLNTYIGLFPSKTQGDWAKDFGISRTFLCEILSGKRMPGRNTMIRIAEVTKGAVPITAWFPDEKVGK